MKARERKPKFRKKEKTEEGAETECRREKILMRPASSRKPVKFVDLEGNEVP